MARTGIVITARERWSATREVVGRVAETVDDDVPVVVVAGRMPRKLRRWVEEVAATRPGWVVVRRDHFLPPQHGRLLGLQALPATDRVLFMDNDALPEPGWLEALDRCMDETGAAAVTPLLFQHEPSAQELHISWGDLQFTEGATGRELVDVHTHQGRHLPEVAEEVGRRRAGFVEFHCVLVDREALEAIGGLDPLLVGSREHLDLTLGLRDQGHELWFEPEARATYLIPRQLSPTDVPFYLSRWSDAWVTQSHERFYSKHDFENELRARLRIVRRRRTYVALPVFRAIRRVAGRAAEERSVKLFQRVETAANRRLVRSAPEWDAVA